MVLKVQFEDVHEIAKRLTGQADFYVYQNGNGTVVTTAAPEKNIVICAESKESEDKVKQILVEKGAQVFKGQWTSETAQDNPLAGGHAYIVAVSYHSSEPKPGLWIDAYPHKPTKPQVLKNMFDELKRTGDLDSITFDEFIRQIDPNVIVVNPDEVSNYLMDKLGSNDNSSQIPASSSSPTP